jgi:integrase
LKIADADEYGAIFKTIVFTGLREAEATGLTWNCVDFKAGRITVCKQLQKRPNKDGGFVFAPLKNDKMRVIAPAPFVMQVLEERRRKQIEDRLKAGTAWAAWSSPKEQENALVFTNSLGEHLHPQTVYNHLKKLVAQVGAPEACVHDLRHTYAVLSLQNGDDVKTVQGNLGHATAAFTLDVYGHVSERMKDDSAIRMQSFID